MKKLFLLLGLVLVLSLLAFATQSCKSPKLITRTSETIIKTDTVKTEVVRIDTVKRNDTVFIKETIEKIKTIENTKTVFVKEECKTKYEIKYEYKIIKDTTRIKAKEKANIERTNAKEKVKTTRINKRNNWWLWLLVGVVIGFVLGKTTKTR